MRLRQNLNQRNLQMRIIGQHTIIAANNRQVTVRQVIHPTLHRSSHQFHRRKFHPSLGPQLLLLLSFTSITDAIDKQFASL